MPSHLLPIPQTHVRNNQLIFDRPLQLTDHRSHCRTLLPSWGLTTQPQDLSPVQYCEFPRTLPHAGTTSTLFLSVDMQQFPTNPLNHPCLTLFPHDFPAIIPPTSRQPGRPDEHSRITTRPSTNRPCSMMTNPLPRHRDATYCMGSPSPTTD
ncbi:hypothetical protein LX32DRAFT_310593 [Colletotrichum zoysiae]|uniref:Uncharacterized protein n=1 Tax=Colletotrichum zoysiae TaxID=1216348 RepID=A0AAD9HMQ3_9PEZI|nr:hypothetical protein LX32DRAFT_310593 [Colletotrichum zoysiae]